VIIFGINICILVIAFLDDADPTHKQNLGSAVIFMNIFLYAVNFLFLGIKFFQGAKRAYLASKEKGVSGKVLFLNLLLIPF